MGGTSGTGFPALDDFHTHFRMQYKVNSLGPLKRDYQSVMPPHMGNVSTLSWPDPNWKLVMRFNPLHGIYFSAAWWDGDKVFPWIRTSWVLV